MAKIQIQSLVLGMVATNVFFLQNADTKELIVIDPADRADVIGRKIGEMEGKPVGILLTHAHFDHIYGLPALLEHYPETKVIVSAYTKEALASAKLNMSKYHGTPIEYTGDNVMVVREGESLRLFEGEPEMVLYETPGHNPGCLTMVLGDLIFTGDAYIPGVGANTRLPRADKALAQQSLERILKLAEGKQVLAGHWIEEM